MVAREEEQCASARASLTTVKLKTPPKMTYSILDLIERCLLDTTPRAKSQRVDRSTAVHERFASAPCEQQASDTYRVLDQS